MNWEYDPQAPLRILMLSEFYHPLIGGAEQHVRTLSQELATRGHEVTVATLWHGQQERSEWDGVVHVQRIRHSAGRLSALFTDGGRRFAAPAPDPGAAVELARIVRDKRPHIVHAHGWLVHSFLPLKVWSGAKLIMTLHDYGQSCVRKDLMEHGQRACTGGSTGKCLPCAPSQYGVAKGMATYVSNRLFAPLVRASVDFFVPVSGSVAKSSGLVGEDHSYRIIPNFVADKAPDPTASDHNLLRLLPGEDFLLFVGAAAHHKGIHVLLEAHRLLEAAPPLVVIAPGSKEFPGHPPSRVHLLRDWPAGAIALARQQSIAGIVPSIWPDPCPTTVIESLAAGRAVVGSSVGGIPELVKHGSTGLLVAPGRVFELKRAMELIIGSEQLRARLGTTARLEARRLQSSAIVPQIEALYRQALFGPAAGDSRQASPGPAPPRALPIRGSLRTQHMLAAR